MKHRHIYYWKTQKKIILWNDNFSLKKRTEIKQKKPPKPYCTVGQETIWSKLSNFFNRIKIF